MSATTLGRRVLSSGPLRQLRLTPRNSPLQYQLQSRFQPSARHSSSLPRIVQPSIWQSVIPRFIRDWSWKNTAPGEKKPPNPASYFIWIYLFIGSQAVRMIGVQKEYKTFMRRAEVKIGLLREVVEKLRKGEPVDVEKALGTGDEAQELEWEEAMKEIEMEERLWQNSKQKNREEQARREAEAQDASPVNEAEGEDRNHVTLHTPTQQSPGFY